MQDEVAKRLEQLRSEFAAGQKMAAELEARQAEIGQTLLRISGAIQVLEELLSQATDGGVAMAGVPSPAPADLSI